jgi:hypothetical protein
LNVVIEPHKTLSVNPIVRSQRFLQITALISGLAISSWADIESGLIAHFAMDETSGLVAVESGGRNPATLVNFPTMDAHWVPGQVDGGLEFNARSNTRAIIDDSAGRLSFSGGSNPAFSLALWIKGKANQPGHPGIMSWTGRGAVHD